MRRQVWLVAALAVGLLATLGSVVAPVAAQAPQGEARVRLLHGSGDTPPVDVYLDGRQVVSSLAFTQASAYLPVTTGRHTFQVFVNGVRPGVGRPLTTVEDVNILANARLTVVAVGFLVDMRWLMVDDATPPPTDGKAKARVVHASLFAPPLDVATRGDGSLFSGTMFDEATPYRAFDARQYDLEIRPAAMEAGNVFISTVTFAANTAYSLYVLNATTVRAFVDAQAPAAANQPTAVRDAPGPAMTAVPAMATAVAALPPQLPAATLMPVALAPPMSVTGAPPLEMGIPQATAPATMGIPATARPANTAVPVATRAATPQVPMAMPATGRGGSDGFGFPLLVLGVLAGAMLARAGVALRHMARYTLH